MKLPAAAKPGKKAAADKDATTGPAVDGKALANVAGNRVILVDSDVLIAHLRGVEPARGWLRETRTSGPLAVSMVSIAELTGGMRSAERREVWALLGALRAEPVTELIARRAGEFMRQYRRSHSGIGIADYLIAATAELHGQQLATLNVRHFPMFADLQPPFEAP